MKINKIFSLITLLIFIFFLCLSSLGMFLGINSKAVNTEWRKLAEFPKINPKMKFSEFPKQFELFFNDNFGFRYFLLSLNTTIMFSLFKEVLESTTIVGTNGWFFHNEAHAIQHSYKYWYNHFILSDQEVDKISNYFLAEKKWLDKRGIGYLFVVVPDKEQIYPEYYPYPEFINSNIQLFQILESLDKKGVPNLYLKSNLIKAKQIINQPLYFKQDTHWNIFGAFFAYQAIMEKLKEQNPDIESFNLSDFDISVSQGDSTVQYDLYRLKSLINDSTKDFKPLITKLKNNSSGKIKNKNRALIYGDSFLLGGSDFVGLSFFLENSFNKIKTPLASTAPLDKAEVEKDHPDIFIREIIQRNIYQFIDPSMSQVLVDN